MLHDTESYRKIGKLVCEATEMMAGCLSVFGNNHVVILNLSNDDIEGKTLMISLIQSNAGFAKAI